MARTAVNPMVLSTPSPGGLPLVEMRAEDGVTWKKGEMAFIHGGDPDPVVTTGKTDVFCIFAEDQDTSTSSTDVSVRRLVPGTRLGMFVTNDGTAAAASALTLGSGYGVYGKSNVSYIDQNTTSGQFKVIRVMSNAADLDDDRYDMDAAPGLVEVEFTGYVS